MPDIATWRPTHTWLGLVPVATVAGLSAAETREWTGAPFLDRAPFTWRGRYEHVDAALAELGAWDARKPGDVVRVLDIAGGVADFGSPTAHDLHDAIRRLGLVPDIVVVDHTIPPEMRESRDGIRYVHSTDESTGIFDAVRLLHVLEHVELDVYDELRQDGLDRLANGGLFVASQEASPRRSLFSGHSDNPNSRHHGYRNGPLIKIAQLRDRGLIPVALMPERWIDFDSFRGDRRPIEQHLALDGYERAVHRIAHAGRRALEHECAGHLEREGIINREVWSPLEVLARNAASSRQIARSARADATLGF